MDDTFGIFRVHIDTLSSEMQYAGQYWRDLVGESYQSMNQEIFDILHKIWVNYSAACELGKKEQHSFKEGDLDQALANVSHLADQLS